MKFWKRAIISIQRKLGKTAILFIVVFILGNIMAGAIAINQATLNVEKNVKSKLGASATVEIDYEKWSKEHGDEENPVYPEDIDVEKIKEIGSLEMVGSYDYSSMGGIQSRTLKPAQEGEDDYFGTNSSGLQYFNINGTQQTSLLDVESGKAKLLEGRSFTEDEINNGKEVVLIAKQFAEENNLSVGSIASFVTVVEDYGDMKGSFSESDIKILGEQAIDLEVIGILEYVLKPADKKNGYDENGWQNAMRMNMLYVPNEVVTAMNKFSVDTMLEARPDMPEEEKEMWNRTYYSSVFMLKSPDLIEDFRAAATPLLPEYNHVVTSSDSYEQIAGSMQMMQRISKMVLYTAIFATVLILTLLIILFIRDRKHEFGIYLALGEPKAKVVGQILTEVVCIAFVAMSLSLVTGSMLAASVSGTMIQSQLENEQDGGMMYAGGGIHDVDVTEDEVIENYKVSITPTYVIVFYAVGLSTVIAATVIPTLYLLRLNPKKIMM